MSDEKVIVGPFALMRAILLCALFAFGLAPQGAEAHSSTPAATTETHAVVDEGHGKNHSVTQEVFGHCHPGTDCALAAIEVDPMHTNQLGRTVTNRFRLLPTTRDGIGPTYEPPPPRSLT